MTERMPLSRAQLAAFLKDPQAIKQFEGLFKSAGEILPDGLSEVSVAAETARASSQQALEELRRIADTLELLAMAPHYSDQLLEAHSYYTSVAEFPGQDDLTPPIQLGTLGQQNTDRVSITGGAVTATLTNNQTLLLTSSQALADGAATALGTLTNAPTAGNPTKWVAIDDNGTTRYIPAW